MSDVANLTEASTTAVNQVVSSAMKETMPKFDEFITISFTYTDGGRWHDIQVTFREYTEILTSGHIDGKPICAVELFTYDVHNAADDRVKLIYDFVLLHTERSPWRVA